MGDIEKPKDEVAPQQPVETNKNPLAINATELPKKRLQLNRSAKLLVLSFILLSVLGGAFLIFRKNDVRIGNQTVNSNEIGAATEAQKKALEAAGFTDLKEADKQAEAQLILLYGLKTEADKQQVKYGEAEVDAFLSSKFEERGGKEGYLAYVSATYGWSKEDVYRQQTIEYLKDKLGKSLLSTRTYSMTFFRWDTIQGSYPDQYQDLYDKSFKRLQEEQLPLYQQKVSKDVLASKAEVTDTMPREQQTKAYEAAMGFPLTYNFISHGPDNPSEGYQKYSNGEDMHTKLMSLQNTGDFTGPFKSNSGILAIIRLEKSEGGPYASWDSLTEKYRSDYKVSFNNSIWDRSVATFSRLTNTVSDTFTVQKVSANQDCLSSHALRYVTRWRDNNTGAQIAAASFSFTTDTDRTTGNCTKSGYTSRGYSVSSGSPSYSVTKSFADNNAGAMGVDLDCNGPAWSVSNTTTGTTVNIAGYTRTGVTYPSGYSNAYPYFSGANGSPAFTTIVHYDKNPPPDQAPSGTMNANCGTISWNASDPQGSPRVLVLVDGQSQGYYGANGSIGFPGAYYNTSSHTVEVRVENVGPSGPYGVSAGTRTVGPCDNVPTLTINADCNAISGTARDPDLSSGQEIDVHISIGSFSQTVRTSGGNYYLAFPASQQDENGRTVNVRAEGYYASGNPAGADTSGSRYVNACDTPATVSSSGGCSTISGSADDANTTATIRVVAYIDGNNVGSANAGPNYSIAVPAQYQDQNTHSVRVDAYNKNGSGNETGRVTSSYSSLGPCDQAPSMTLNANCNTIFGTASDPNNGSNLTIRIYVGGTYLTTTTNNGNFSIAYPTGEQDNNGRTVTATADGIRMNGDTAGIDTTRSVGVSACYSASCTGQSINGGIVTATQGFSTNASFRNNGQLSWPNGRITTTSSYNSQTSSPAVPGTNPGGTASMTYGTFNTPATLNQQSLSMQLRLDGNKVIATCAITFDPYTDFTLTPLAEEVRLQPDRENPNDARFNSRVNVAYIQVPGAGVQFNGPTSTRVITKNGSQIGSFSSNGTYASSYTAPTHYTQFSDTAAVPPPKNLGDNFCGQLTLSHTTGKVNRNGSVANLAGGGSAGGACESISNKPYMRIYGGDVSAGAGFTSNGSCSGASAGHIGYSNGGAGSVGTGVQLAAYATATITDYTTANMRGSSPTSPRGLSFSNVTAGNGGSLNSAFFPCVADFYSGNTPSFTNGQAIPGRTLGAGQREIVYAQGDVVITGNIQYANSTGYANASQVPSFRLVTSGNVYVLNTVTRLDGIYVVQPVSGQPNTGRFITCTTSGSNPTMPNQNTVISQCNQKLTINGSVISRLIKPLRSNGTLRTSPGGFEPYNSPNIAETILFTPEVWLSPGLPTTGSSSTDPYDSYTTLAPVL